LNKVTAIGEILYDIYPDGKRLGGAPFNFIYHIWKLSSRANFISSVGNDENGTEILSYLKGIGFNTDYISIDKLHPTGTVLVTLRDDKTPQFTISPECSYDFIELNEPARKLIDSGTDLIYFGTLSQRSPVTRNTITSLFNRGRKFFCDLNLRHDFFSKEMIKETLRVSDVVKINTGELQKIVSLLGLDQNTNDAAAALIKNFMISLLAVTDGENGALLFSPNELDACRPSATNIVDTLGAGDAYAAVLCLGFLRDLPIKEINKAANDFAAEICSVPGALPKDDTIYKKYHELFG
jgi:fructokinase